MCFPSLSHTQNKTKKTRQNKINWEIKLNPQQIITHHSFTKIQKNASDTGKGKQQNKNRNRYWWRQLHPIGWLTNDITTAPLALSINWSLNHTYSYLSKSHFIPNENEILIILMNKKSWFFSHYCNEKEDFVCHYGNENKDFFCCCYGNDNIFFVIVVMRTRFFGITVRRTRIFFFAVMVMTRFFLSLL